MNNKGYIFQNYFDAICYLVIAIIYPVLCFGVQSNQPNEDLISKLNLLITGLFFSATFFYDYYQRFRDCCEQTKIIVNLLFIGRLAFCVFTIFAFIFFIIIAGNFIPTIEVTVMTIFTKLPFAAVYPSIIAIVEIGRRMYFERKGKISKANV